MDNNTPPARPERLIKIDAEHARNRFLIPFVMIGMVLVVHLGGMSLLSGALSEGSEATCLVLLADASALIVAGYLAERALRRVFPSRRLATLSSEGLVVTDGRRNPPHVARFAWDKTVNAKAWHFTIRQRRSRVRKGWHCMALHLLQDEEEAILYTFMPPQEAEAAVGYRNFVRLRSRQDAHSNTDLGAAAEQLRLLKLEDARWLDGAEISREDFGAVLATLQRRVPGWK